MGHGDIGHSMAQIDDQRFRVHRDHRFVLNDQPVGVRQLPHFGALAAHQPAGISGMKPSIDVSGSA